MTFSNADVKLEAISKGVRLYEIAPHLNTNQSWFNRVMRTELSDEDREKILKAIDEIAKSRAV